MERLAPSQRTDYVALLNEWAIGFYTELDFNNEAANATAMKEALATRVPDIFVPAVVQELSTRRLLVTEWVDGVKLTACDQAEIASLTAVGQEAFLTQLLTLGFFHADPHPGNLLRLNDQSKGRLALIDFGLVARLSQDDRDALVAAVVHLANKDYAALIDDFVKLQILPADTPRATVEPLMARVLGPYVSGGGGLQGAIAAYGGASGVQSLTNDMLTALSAVPFSIPPYFALLAVGSALIYVIYRKGFEQSLPHLPDEPVRKLEPKEWRTLIITVGASLLWLTDAWHHWHPAIPALIAWILLLMPRFGVLTWKEFERDIGWANFFVLASSLSLARALKVSGASDWVASLITASAPAFQGQPYYVIATLLIVSVPVRLLIPNITGFLATTIPIAMAIGTATGVNPMICGLAVMIGGDAVLYYPAQSVSSLAVYERGYLSAPDIFKFGVWMTLAAFVVVLVVALPYWAAVGVPLQVR